MKLWWDSSVNWRENILEWAAALAILAALLLFVSLL